MLEKAMIDYLKDNHPRSNPAPMSLLAEKFDLTERGVRRTIESIILSQEAVIGNLGGYWVASNEEEVMEANLINESRAKKAIEKMFANGFKNTKWIHAFIKELENKYPHVAEGQLDIENEPHTYY